MTLRFGGKGATDVPSRERAGKQNVWLSLQVLPLRHADWLPERVWNDDSTFRRPKLLSCDEPLASQYNLQTCGLQLLDLFARYLRIRDDPPGGGEGRDLNGEGQAELAMVREHDRFPRRGDHLTLDGYLLEDGYGKAVLQRNPADGQKRFVDKKLPERPLGGHSHERARPGVQHTAGRDHAEGGVGVDNREQRARDVDRVGDDQQIAYFVLRNKSQPCTDIFTY